MRALAKTNTKAAGVFVFGMLTRQILSVLGSGSGLDARQVTRGYIMDYCNNMRDIFIGLHNGPKFCPDCEQWLSANRRSYLVPLVSSAKQLLSQRRDANALIGKRMRLRDEVTIER
jgi:hypothetical protein